MAGALMEERRFHLVLRSDESEYDDVANLWIWRLPSPIMLSNRLMQVFGLRHMLLRISEQRWKVGVVNIVLPATRQFRRSPKMLVVGTPVASSGSDGQAATLAGFAASGLTTQQNYSPVHITMFPVQLFRMHEFSLSLFDIDREPVQFATTAPPFVVTLVFASDLL